MRKWYQHPISKILQVRQISVNKHEHFIVHIFLQTTKMFYGFESIQLVHIASAQNNQNKQQVALAVFMRMGNVSPVNTPWISMVFT